jgi:hypothetical protein
MRIDEARRFSLSLPEASEQPHFDMSSFRIRGKIFATVSPDEARLHVFVDEGESRAAVTADSRAFEELWWGGRLRGVRVNLAAASPAPVYELLEEAWRCKAPKRLVAAYDVESGHGL